MQEYKMKKRNEVNTVTYGFIHPLFELAESPSRFESRFFYSTAIRNLTAFIVSHCARCNALYGTPTMFIDVLNHPAFDKFDVSSLHTGEIY